MRGVTITVERGRFIWCAFGYSNPATAKFVHVHGFTAAQAERRWRRAAARPSRRVEV